MYPAVVTTGDTLEVRYYLDARVEASTYRLGIADVLRIDIDGHPELGRDGVTILPDGTISLPLIGSVKVASQTSAEASATIAEQYRRRQIKNPVVVVSALQSQQRLRRLLESRRQQADSDSFVLQVYEGVPIQLPLIEPVAVDRPLDEIRQEISAKYAEEFGTQINVVVNLRQRAQPTVTVMGEVKIPGRVTMTMPLGPMAAIAAAGGYAVTADPTRVAVVRFGKDGIYQRWLFNLTEGLNDEHAPQHAFQLNYDDIVLVLKTGVANANVWIDQYIRQNIPIPIGIEIPLYIQPVPVSR